MIAEGLQTEHKSLRLVTERRTDWDDVARACVCFANGAGGSLLIGIEDAQVLPPPTQRIPVELLDRARKRIGELTVNVQVLPAIVRAENGGEVLQIVVERSPNVASTSDGRYFIRVADSCLPVLGDDVLRLANERPGRPWEAMETDVRRTDVDPLKLERFVAGLRASDRVKDSVREKGVDELLTHTRWPARAHCLVSVCCCSVLPRIAARWAPHPSCRLSSTMRSATRSTSGSGMTISSRPSNSSMRSGRKCLTFARVMKWPMDSTAVRYRPTMRKWCANSS